MRASFHMVCSPLVMAGGRRFLCSILHSPALLMNSQNRYIFLQSVISVPYFYLYAVESLVDGLFRLHEAILTTPRGITRLMDMLMDREVTVSAVGHENVDSS